MATDVHEMVLDKDFTDGLWVAGCSCGWESRKGHKRTSAAAEDWEDHCDVVFMEATGG